MKLANVFGGNAAVGRLATAKLPPKVAYRVLKFARKFEAEFAIVEKQRIALLRDATGAKENEEISLKPDDPKFAEFVEKFNEVLGMDSDLEVCPLKFDTLIDSLDLEDDNVLSAQDLAVLEPFFESDEKLMDNVKPDLEVVK
jgi:hypothetical protein